MAASQGAVKAGEAYVEAGLRDNKLRSAMRATEARLKAWGASLVSIGSKVALASAAAITPFLAAARSFADSGAALSDMADRTNTAASQLSSLGAAAETVGANLGDIETALTTTTAALADANTGGIESIRMFNRLGVSVQRLRAMTPDEQFRTLADAIARMRNPFDQAALAAQVFGGAGARLLPLLRQGRAGIEGLEGEARRLGATLTNEDAAGAADFRASIAMLTGTLRGAWQMIGAALAPTLRDLAVQITEVVGSVSRWIRANPGMVRGIFLAVAGVGALGVAIGTAGVALIAIGSTIGLVTTAMAALVSLPGLFAVGVVAAIAATTDFTGVLAVLGQTWGGIIDMISAGDFQGALGVAILGAKLVWFEFVDAIGSAWDGAINGLAVVLLNGWEGIKSIWRNGTNWLGGMWDNVVSGWHVAWNRFVTSLEVGWARLTLRGSEHIAALRAAGAEREAAIVGANLTAQMVRDLDNQAENILSAMDAAQTAANITGPAAGPSASTREAQQALEEAVTEAMLAAGREEENRQARRDEIARGVGDATGGPNGARRLSAVGSFDSTAIRGFAGGSTPEERTARATEQAQRVLEQILAQARNGGIVFA